MEEVIGPNSGSVPSPIATGLSGGFFEQHVNATWLSLLLVKAIPPLLLDTQIVKVGFQSRHLGWKTDDVLIYGETSKKQSRKIAAQIKRKFTVSKDNEDCRKTFHGFWADFTGTHFTRNADRLCLITLKGTNTLLDHLNGLYECAQASNSLAEFNLRLATTGVLHGTAKRYAQEIRDGLAADSCTVSDEEFWQFLKHLFVLSFDLNSATSQTEAWVRTLLAQSVSGVDKVNAAKNTWDAILAIVSNAMPNAREFSREDLPEELKTLHVPIPNADHTTLHALSDHSKTILRGINGTINGSVALKRELIVASASEKLADNRIIVLSGHAGAGKSAVAKTLVDSVSGQCFVFSFRAEEFAKAHLDETLRGFGLGISGERLSALLAAQSQKVIVIESVERLLEASVRDSFSDLFRLIERDKSWKVVLTCRAYSIDLVVASFLDHLGLPYSIVNVPELNDDELLEVEKAIPQLALPLSSERLRGILRNPYILDKAARMSWPQGESLPQNVREFRRRFWKDIVREDNITEGGLPLRREKSLQELALRRAKALSLFARCDDLDLVALQKLHQKNLINFSEATDTMAAPAHDVLEDWALQQWIDLQFTHLEGDTKKLAEAIGTFPALRRGYRLWLSELSEYSPDVADTLVQAVIGEPHFSAHFRDDTIVSLLKSSGGSEFIKRNKASLTANNSAHLKRLVHLLRVACKSMPDWLATIGYLQSSVMVPTGSSWPTVLNIINEKISDFIPKDAQLLLGLLEDWSNLVSAQVPYPEGYEDAAKITFALLKASGGYRGQEVRKRIFGILCKIPTGDKSSFVELLSRGGEDDREADEFSDFLLGGHESFYVACEFPNELIELTKRRLYSDRVPDSDPFDRIHRLDVDEFFGLNSHREYYPPSAIRGPFWSLLQQHFKTGVEFIVEFANRAGENYVNPSGPDGLEPAWQVEVVLPDGTKIKQWHNPRLWQLYRGTSVGAYVLMCSLMALESRLLSMGKVNSKNLDSWLVYIIRNSNNSSLSAVAAGVVAAYPTLCIAAAKALLSCRDYLIIDESMAAISGGVSQMQEIIPSTNVESKLYESERRESDSLSHRRKHIGVSALELQAQGFVEDIQPVLEAHLKALPPVEKQDQEDKLWRLALHRYDIRSYEPKAATKKEIAQASGQTASGEDSNKSVGIILEPKSPAADLKEIIDREKPRIENNQLLLGMQSWAWRCFTRDNKANPSLWREYLKQAMLPKAEAVSEDDAPWGNAPSLVASVCARDNWTELTDAQKEWCLSRMSEAVLKDRDSKSDLVKVSRHPMSPDRPAALVASKLIASEPKGKFRDQAVRILGNSLFHACDEVTLYAAAGIGQFLWPDNSELAIQCVYGISSRAKELDEIWQLERSKDYQERENPHSIQMNLDSKFRKSWEAGNAFLATDFEKLDLSSPYAGESLRLLLCIFENAPETAAAKSFFSKISAQISSWWTAKDEGERTPFEVLYECMDKLSHFALKQSPDEAVRLVQPLLDLVENKAREVADFVRKLVSAEDATHLNKPTFWRLWEEFSKQLLKAKWLPRLDSEHFSNDEILRAMFLGLSWKRGSKVWEPHRGYEDRIVSLFNSLPASEPVFDQLAVYFYYIGDMTLPGSFIPLAKKIKEAPGKLSGKNTIFCFEQALQRYVYGSPQKLKSNPALREAVILILDELVERGSSAAYKMRDDFVTPIKE